MKTVFKYTVPITDHPVQIGLPHQHIIRHIGYQSRNAVTFWAEVPDEPDMNPITRLFQVFGTGHQIPDSAVYIGTSIQGEFVWHLYEVRS